jgi:hypothetical protein
LHRSNGFGDDFPAASADRHFRSLRQLLGSPPSSRTRRYDSKPMIDAARRPGSSNTPAVPARTAITSGNKATSLIPPREARRLQLRHCYAYPTSRLLNPASRVGRCTESFGTTMLWRMTLQRRRGKSPLAIESIDDRYCHSPCGVMPFR